MFQTNDTLIASGVEKVGLHYFFPDLQPSISVSPCSYSVLHQIDLTLSKL